MALDYVRTLLTRSTFWIFTVLALHFALCIFCLSKLPGDEDFQIVAGITASQPVQWSYMAFCLASVFFIVQAYVGAVYMLESHLNMYYYFLIASILVDVTCLFLFIWAWLSAVGLVVALVLSIAFKIAALYITSKYSKLVRSQYNAELLPQMKSHLGRSFNVAPFQPAPRLERPASMQERSPPQFDAPKAWQTMPDVQPSPQRLVRVVQ